MDRLVHQLEADAALVLVCKPLDEGSIDSKRWIWCLGRGAVVGRDVLPFDCLTGLSQLFEVVQCFDFFFML